MRVLRRIGQAILTLFVAATLVWALQLAAPGDPARALLSANGVDNPVPAQIEATRAELGLNDPAWQRYATWLGGAVRGDLGESWRTGRPVAVELGERLPATLRLAVVALLLALLMAVPAALIAAAGRNQLPDLVARSAMFLGAATPSFVIGSLLLDIVVLDFGIGQVIADGSWQGAVLPAIPLAIGAAATWARVLRSSLVDTIDAGHVFVAQARGATLPRRLLVHALPNSSPGLLAAIGVTVGSLVAGAAVVETVFTWPGIGRYLVEAIAARDVPVVQGTVLLGVLGYVVTSLVIDVLTTLVTPGRRT